MATARKLTLQTSGRDEFIRLFTDMAQALNPEFVTENTQPLFINITGGPITGKSLVWDTLKDEFIGANHSETGIFVDDPEERVYEHWEGPNTANGKLTTVFFCNAVLDRTLFKKTLLRCGLLHDPELSLFHFGKKDLPVLSGAVLITSFGDYEVPKDINIRVKNGDGGLNGWQRHIDIIAGNSILRESPKYRAFHEKWSPGRS